MQSPTALAYSIHGNRQITGCMVQSIFLLTRFASGSTHMISEQGKSMTVFKWRPLRDRFTKLPP